MCAYHISPYVVCIKLDEKKYSTLQRKEIMAYATQHRWIFMTLCFKSQSTNTVGFLLKKKLEWINSETEVEW